MSAAPDSTLLWCLERLCTADELPYEVLVNLAGFFSSNNQLPGVVRCRMILKGLANTLGVDYSILGSLTLLSGPIPDVSTDLLPYLIPPAELILQVRCCTGPLLPSRSGQPFVKLAMPSYAFTL